MSRTSDTIRALNDAFRTGERPDLGIVVTTRGIVSFGMTFLAKAVLSVQMFEAFTPENDPHGEHDFGSFKLESVLVYWKID